VNTNGGIGDAPVEDDVGHNYWKVIGEKEKGVNMWVLSNGNIGQMTACRHTATRDAKPRTM
jgi:hypothetical protein